MANRTSLLLAALGQEGALEVVLVLLHSEEGEVVGGVQQATGLPQATVTRRLQELMAAGLIAQDRRGRPFLMREKGALGDLLRGASELGERLLDLDKQAEYAFRESLALRPGSEGS